MDVIADLHLHGRFSRATSKDLTIANLEKYARIKGIGMMGTGDFTHPEWIKELKAELTEDDTGILHTNQQFPFMLTSEISLMYSQGGKGRRIHHVVWAPSFDAVAQVTAYLKTKGRVDYDGRPIFNIPSPDFVERLKEIDDRIEIIPAHIWTPYFGLFGSMTGFDALKDCFGDQTKHIHAVETGLSSDPPMNWRLSQLDAYTQVSFSDLHSFWPWRIGREATIFDVKKLTYAHIIDNLKEKSIKGTIEVDPGYGKYHFDGHRDCNVCQSPEATKKTNGICPVCRKKLTIGVLNRVEQLADRPEGFVPKKPIPFHSVIPLTEILSFALGKPLAHKTVWKAYYDLVSPENKRTEFDILLKLTSDELKKYTDDRIASLVLRNREAKITVQPGYDGEYGVPNFEGSKTVAQNPVAAKPVQRGLNDF